MLSTEGRLGPNGWCQAHKETWYLVNGAEHRETWNLMDGTEHKKTWYLVNDEQMETWYLMDGAEQNKTRVLLAGDDCDGVGHVKVCARTG